jgi:hypothetical protein
MNKNANKRQRDQTRTAIACRDIEIERRFTRLCSEQATPLDLFNGFKTIKPIKLFKRIKFLTQSFSTRKTFRMEVGRTRGMYINVRV